VKEDPDSISPFVVFIKGVLDYLDKLTIEQIGVLFDIFSFIAVEVGSFPFEYLEMRWRPYHSSFSRIILLLMTKVCSI
jgi:hypothetical protein